MIFFIPNSLEKTIHEFKQYKTETEVNGHLLRIILRTALAAIGLVAYNLGASPFVSLAAGACFSPPALAIATGCSLIYFGITSITMLSSTSAISSAIATSAVGLYILLRYSTPEKNFGMIEDFIFFLGETESD